MENTIHTCSMTIRSCESLNLEIKLKGLNQEKAKRIYRIATATFRDVEIVSETTGEILASRYISDDWHTQFDSYANCLDEIERVYRGA